MRVLVSVVERDMSAIGALVGEAPNGTLRPLEPFAAALCRAGLRVVEHRAVAQADIDCLGSSWARRLGIPARRPAVLLTAER